MRQGTKAAEKEGEATGLQGACTWKMRGINDHERPQLLDMVVGPMRAVE